MKHTIGPDLLSDQPASVASTDVAQGIPTRFGGNDRSAIWLSVGLLRSGTPKRLMLRNHVPGMSATRGS